MNYLTATINEKRDNAINRNGQKELINRLSLIARVDGKLKTVVDARFYMSYKASATSPVYCSMWVTGKDTFTSGAGEVGGWGYHKESAALQDAITSAGISLFGDVYGKKINTIPASIDGVGQLAMRSATLAIALAAGADISEFIFVE